ncbi:competence protein ComK [Alkalibacillus filiformis]|uniref:Competence protein ComK n=1 Tax=Alkalibacillus filiformis TaxID=200990 RepID=A0ABU0DTE0_9BACI|nr:MULTISPECIES: competence protein ComK [Alkalibacillus]MDQ0351722.1 competence protein ComK [Alkalibacillus filiformis]
MEIKENGRISAKTMAVLPHKFSDGVYGSYVVDTDDEFYSYLTPKQLMDDICNYYACSLKGRLDGTRKAFGVSRKAPIVVEASSGMFFMPTTSPHSNECAWIAHSYVLKLERLAPKMTRIYFHGGKTLTVNYSQTSLTNQLNRTAQYRHLVMERISNYQL